MKKKLTFLLSLMILVTLFSGCNKNDNDEQETTSEVTQSAEETSQPDEDTYDGYRNPLTGEAVEADISQNRPFAVMLNNTQVALPQFGNSQADIIYEMLTEYGITRMMGVYQDISKVGTIGSVRSVRSHFLDCAQGLDAILIHAGGSDMAYEDISSRGIDHIDGVKGSTAIFYRDQDRINSVGREHSMFTTSELIAENSSNFSFRTNHEDGYLYEMDFADDGTPNTGESADSLEIVFSTYKTGLFEYNDDDGLYYVSEYGAPYVDGGTEKQVAVTNVLVLKSKFTQVGDTILIQTDFVGSGDGYYVCGGKYIPIKWSKSSYTDQFVYTLEDGTELTLGRGKSYVNIVPTDTEINFS